MEQRAIAGPRRVDNIVGPAPRKHIRLVGEHDLAQVPPHINILDGGQSSHGAEDILNPSTVGNCLACKAGSSDSLGDQRG